MKIFFPRSNHLYIKNSRKWEMLLSLENTRKTLASGLCNMKLNSSKVIGRVKVHTSLFACLRKTAASSLVSEWTRPRFLAYCSLSEDFSEQGIGQKHLKASTSQGQHFLMSTTLPSSGGRSCSLLENIAKLQHSPIHRSEQEDVLGLSASVPFRTQPSCHMEAKQPTCKQGARGRHQSHSHLCPSPSDSQLPLSILNPESRDAP